MGLFDRFPGTITHWLNLDWLLQTVGKIKKRQDDLDLVWKGGRLVHPLPEPDAFGQTEIQLFPQLISNNPTGEIVRTPYTLPDGRPVWECQWVAKFKGKPEPFQYELPLPNLVDWFHDSDILDAIVSDSWTSTPMIVTPDKEIRWSTPFVSFLTGEPGIPAVIYLNCYSNRNMARTTLYCKVRFSTHTEVI